MEKGAIIKHEPKNAPKTGDWRYMKPEINASKCIGCGTCVPYCPEAVMELKEKEKQKEGSSQKIVDIDFEYCKGCGVCATVCPIKAITMKK
jgi:pyruvate ferredoxin oxidoreductase delta subunit